MATLPTDPALRNANTLTNNM